MSKFLLAGGGIAAFLGVALGAFGAHGLRGHLSEAMLAVYQTGVQYHLIHALALVLIGVLSQLMPDSQLLKAAGVAMLVGIILFSGSLYLLAVTEARWLGAVTPIGGSAFLLGWVLLTLAVIRS